MPSLFKNTGEQEKEQVDTNPTSPSFGSRRWVVSGVNTTACPIPPPASTQFRSVLIVETVYRDDCANGDLPDGVTYRVEEGFRTSVLSQQDADQQARAYFDANKQAFANANDTCTADPASSFTCEYDTSGCWTGYVIIPATGDRRIFQTSDEYDTCFVFKGGNSGPLELCPAL